MSIMSVGTILDRIKIATPESPIAVFKEPKPYGGGWDLDAVFASTICSQNRILKKDPFLVGVYHKEMSMFETSKELRDATV